MSRTTIQRWALAGFVVFFGWFYYRYVPLIPAYQAVLVPILVFLVIRTASDAGKGLVAFCFLFPLINSLPYFFGIGDRIPHAPAALVAFMALALGLSLGVGRGDAGFTPTVAFLPLSLKLLAVWGGLSALITFLRYLDFFPFAAAGIRELRVNVAGLSAGGARMSVVFSSASLLCGLAMFAFFRSALADPRFRARALWAFSLSALLAFLFGWVQGLGWIAAGNTPYWKKLGQINATFKDPNSLAAFIAGFLPLLVAFALSQSGPKRAVLAVVAALGLAVMPFSGSRSGMAALGVGAVVFLAGTLRTAGKALRRRAAAGAAGLVLLFMVWNLLAVHDSPWSRRIGWSVDPLKATVPGDFFNHRLTLWAAAGRMLRDAPLTGIGLGAFIVTVPDDLWARHRPLSATDSALNLIFQIGAETGLVGLGLTLVFLAGLIGRMKRIGRHPARGGAGDWIRIGAAGGLAAFFFNFLFHTYAASFEIQFLFWFLAALVYSEAPVDAPNRPRGASSRIVPLAAAGLTAASAVFLALSIGPYSIGARAEKFGWTQAFGFYAPETDPEVGGFRWTGKIAGFSLIRPEAFPVVTLRAANPDLASHPLRVRVYRTDRHFRKTELAAAVLLTDSRWTRCPLVIPGGAAAIASFVIEPERTWNPRRFLGASDGRDLGVSVRTLPGGGPTLERP